MKHRFRKKLKLKKKFVFLGEIFFLFLIVLFIQNINFLKNILNINAKKYIQNNYVQGFEKLSMVSHNKEKQNKDEIFTVKEEKNATPLIYIYNTHQTEKYIQENLAYSPTVVHASKYLSEKFNSSGLESIVENRSIANVLQQNGWSYGSSYKVSRIYMEDTFKENNEIKYFFDIHRDAGSHNYTTLCINEKCYAKILFLIGLENPGYIENQKYAEVLNKKINEKVKGLSKGILQKQGKKVNGVYNQDFSSRTILIEVGGENNNIEEVYNTLDILSEVLIEYIKEEINYGK